MITYEEALERVLAAACPLPSIKKLLRDAQAQVLAEPAMACWDMPRWNNSAMDGFAIAKHTEQTGGAYALVGTSFAGHPYPGSIRPGEAVHITTGGVLPAGADAVVPLEEAELSADKNSVTATGTVKKGQHIRLQGEEFRAGEQLLAPGVIIHSGEIGLLASAGVTSVNVYAKPRVAIFATGDELVEAGSIPGPGQIINSNLLLLSARLKELGFETLELGIAQDEPERLQTILKEACKADLIISSGGVSVGEKDQVQATLSRFNFDRTFWKVAIKPGKPLLFGRLEGKLFLGLPGNPAATAVTFELFAVPALKRLAAQTGPVQEKRSAVLTNSAMGGGKRQTVLWGVLEWRAGCYHFTVTPHQGSGQNRCLSGTNALLPMPIGGPSLRAGEQVEVLLIRK